MLPNTPRYATASVGRQPGNSGTLSPSARPVAVIHTEPQIICPAADMKGAGSDRPRLQIEPQAHAMGATISAIMPRVEPDSSPPALSHSTPAKPIPRPT